MNDTIGMNSCCSHEEKMSEDFVVITSEEEEDWFVGDHVIDHIVGDHVVGDEHGLNSSSNGCCRSVGNIRTTLFPHPEPEQTPESVLLTPLEGYDNNNRERCERPWDDAPRDTPPAGQSTSEKNQEEGSPNRNNVIHVIPRTAMVEVPNRTLDASNDFHNTATNTTLANTTTIQTGNAREIGRGGIRASVLPSHVLFGCLRHGVAAQHGTRTRTTSDDYVGGDCLTSD
jgi:hypothetical protein